jgi:uncharacterized protein
MNINGSKDITDSPCIGICSTTYGDDFCMGCGRSFDEVNNWNKLSNTEKIAINQRLLQQKKS